jgi:capsid assembly protease
MTLLDLLTGCWAIMPDKLREIQAIYATHMRGEKIDIPAVEARLGRPLHRDDQRYSVTEGGIAVLPISGVIAPKANLFMQISGGMSLQQATKQLESALADPSVRGIVQLADTPGGSVLGTPEYAAAVHEYGAVKPIVTLSDGVLASAGYWFGAAANHVYITGPTVQVGSIGVVATHSYDPRAAETHTEITAGRYKRIASSISPLSEEGKAAIQADVDYVYSLFVDHVAKFRAATSEQVLEHMADGRVFRGQQAIDAGLVDGVSTLDALTERMATKPDEFKQRRKAVFALGGPSAKPAGAQASGQEQAPVLRNDQPTLEGSTMDRATLEQQHSALFAQLRQEFMSAGAEAERNRVAAVRAQSLPGHEALIEQLATDGKTTGDQAAAAVLAAERKSRQAAIDAHASDAPPAAKPSAAPGDQEKTKQQQVEEAQAYMKANKGVDLVGALKALGHAK